MFDQSGSVAFEGPGNRHTRAQVRVVRAGENRNVETDYEAALPWAAFYATVCDAQAGMFTVSLAAGDLRVHGRFALDARVAEALRWLEHCRIANGG